MREPPAPPAPDPLERLTRALADRYVIERELGRGGMATVYLATDVKHARRVAVKVLRPELAHALGSERFLREIRISAQLNHPHIIPLHDSGEADGFLYYVMPYIEGESLRDRLTREKQLPLEDALTVTREVADAIAHAHSYGIVHRDLKPENILLSGGHAVVADFGIARAVSAAGGEKLTETGLAIGTPAYMSPEQASGEAELDARSDVYSLGCVLYEMLIGDPPYTGATPQVVLARKSLEAAPLLRAIRETVPPSVEHAVARALARIPADRFATARQFVEALEQPVPAAAPQPAERVPSWRWLRWMAAAAGLLVLAIGGYVGVTRIFGSSTRSATDAPPRILVLPFEHLGPPEEAYFADGITDLITSRLARLSGLRVIGRTTAIQYRRTDKTIAQIGAEVDVDYVLEGTISWDRSNPSASRVRVIPQLIRVSDESHLWADPYEATLTDIFGLQADVAERIAQALDVALLEPERRTLRARLTDNEEAYDAFLRGSRFSPFWTFLASERLLAIESFERAVELDPEFAEAHALLAAHYAWLSEVTPGEAEHALSLAERHADLALTLQPDLAWGHLAKASYLSVRYTDPERLLPHLERAERAAPNASEILETIAVFYMGAIGDFDRALQYNRRALDLDPLRPDNAFGVGFSYFALRRHAESEPYLDRAIELAPDRLEYHHFTAWFYLSWQGSIARARVVLEAAVQRFGQEPVAAGMMSAWWLARLTATDDWFRDVLEQTSLGTPNLDSTSYYLSKAALYDGLGNRAGAREYADSATRLLEGRSLDFVPWRQAKRHQDLAIAHALMGDSTRAVREARQALGLAGSRWDIQVFARTDLALTYAQVGAYDSAVAQFDRVLSEPNYVTPTLLSLDPALAPLRRTPQYQALLRKHDR